MNDFVILAKTKKKLEERITDVGYSGQQMMLESIKSNYWWPGIRNNIKKYV